MLIVGCFAAGSTLGIMEWKGGDQGGFSYYVALIFNAPALFLTTIFGLALYKLGQIDKDFVAVSIWRLWLQFSAFLAFTVFDTLFLCFGEQSTYFLVF